MTDAGRLRPANLRTTSPRLAILDAAGGTHQHRLACRSCGAVIDVDCVDGHLPSVAAAESSGFQLDAAEVAFWGLCARCQVPAGEPGQG